MDSICFFQCINSGVYLCCSWCTVLPQATHHFRRSSVQKTIVKLAGFLITEDVLIVTGRIVLFAVNLWVILESIDGVYLSLVLHMLSFTPTPILVVFLKPVQKGLSPIHLHHLFCCKHFKGNGTIPMQQDG